MAPVGHAEQGLQAINDKRQQRQLTTLFSEVILRARNQKVQQVAAQVGHCTRGTRPKGQQRQLTTLFSEVILQARSQKAQQAAAQVGGTAHRERDETKGTAAATNGTLQ
jgi:hypothetical protein